MGKAKHTPGPWEYVPSTANHGPYVANGWGAGDICDCYAMSNPLAAAACNGGDSKPINHQGDEAEANARLIAAAPDMLEALTEMVIAAEGAGLDAKARRKKALAAGLAAIAKAEGRS